MNWCRVYVYIYIYIVSVIYYTQILLIYFDIEVFNTISLVYEKKYCDGI